VRSPSSARTQQRARPPAKDITLDLTMLDEGLDDTVLFGSCSALASPVLLGHLF
jgi:hypothetical protein